MKKQLKIRKTSAKSARFVKKSVKKTPVKKLAKKTLSSAKKTAGSVKKTVKSVTKKVKKMAKTLRGKPARKEVAPKVLKKRAAKKAITKKERKKMKPFEKHARKAAIKVKKKIKASKEVGYDPEKDSDYMGLNMENYFRTLLLDMKKQVQDQMAKTVSNLQKTVIREADDSDRASQEEAFGLELRERDRGRKLLKKIEETIELIDNKEYGYCKVCGEEIGVKRLKVRPTAVLCIDCKTFDEIREKQEGF